MEDLERPSFSLKKFLFGKINRKLISVFLIISVVPIILFGIILFSIISPSANQVSLDVEIGLEQIIHESTSFEVDLLRGTIEGQLEDYLSLFQSIMLDKEFSEALREANDAGTISDDRFYPADRSENWFYLNDQFKETYEIMKSKIDMIRLFHGNGYIVNGVVLGEEDTSDYKGDKSWFIKVINPLEVPSDSYYISPIGIARRTDSSAIRYVTPIEENGERLGLFIINFKASAITGEIESFSLGESGGAMLIDLNYKNAEGEVSPWPVVLSRSVDEGVYLINESEVAQASLGKNDLKGSSGEIIYDVGDVEWHGHYGKVNFQDKEWYVVVSAPKEELFLLVSDIDATTRAIQSRVRTVSILILIFVVFLSTILGITTSRSFSKPIKILSDANEQIKNKNFKVRVDVKTGDELEVLGNSFNETAKVLEGMDKEHKQLEKSKTEFLSITSHELRSPMTPMQAQLQMLLGEYYGKLNEKQKNAMEIVSRNTKRLDNIIVDFLEISRIEAARLKFRFVRKNPADIIPRLVKEMEGFMPERKIKIVTKIGKLPVIEHDPDRLSQALRNLMNNAIKFSKPGTKIIVSASLKEGMIEFSVADQGIGIRPEDQRRIFEPFFQAEQTMYREHQGTGLGLAIIRGIAESQGGKVWLESKVGVGTTFYFTLPLKPLKVIRPIKLLFSETEGRSKRIKEIFVEMLGPMGSQEFDNLDRKNQLNKKDLIWYVDILIKKGILSGEKGEVFKVRILGLFGEKGVKE